MSFDDIRYYFFSGIMWLSLLGFGGWFVFGVIMNIYNFLVGEFDKSSSNPEAEKSQRQNSEAIAYRKSLNFEIDANLSGMQLLMHMAHRFAHNHGHQGLLHGHQEILNARFNHILRNSWAALKPEDRALLEPRLRTIMAEGMPRPEDFQLLLRKLIKNMDKLHREWIGELIKQSLQLSQVLGPTNACLTLVRQLSEPFGFKINQHKQPERPAEKVVHDKLGHYATLGVASDADDAAIKSAYRKLALLFHPDRSKHPDAKARFQMIQKAYETLSDPVSRKAYDQIP